MSLNKVECAAITQNNLRCSRFIDNEQLYCWQHLELVEIKNDLDDINILPYDILQHVLNPYLDYNEEVPLVQELLENRIELNITPHLKTNETYENDILTQRETFLDEKLIKIEEWYKNGNLKSVENYKNNLLDGIGTIYYKNGTDVWYSTNYKNGLEEGKQYKYYSNGIVAYKSNYKNGVEDGVQYTYDINGTLLSIRTYKNGVKNGPERIYLNNKNILTYNYKNGVFINESLK